MKASELLNLLGATRKGNKGRRDKVKVSERRCAAWAARHQDLLRRAFRDRTLNINLTDGESNLPVLGFERIEMPDGDERWIHPMGDDYGDRAVLGLVDATGDAMARRQRGARMLHGLLAASES